jgi:surfactin synthase thioesterase subunit
MFIRPAGTFEHLLQSPKRLQYSFYALLVPAIGYTLFYIMAYNAGGSPSTFKPWLALPIEEYFKYDIILTLPGYYLGWICGAATIFLVARLMNGTGKFIDTLVIIGFGAGVATWSSMLHDLTDAVLSTLGIIDMQEYERLLNEPTFWRYLLLFLYLIYFTWFIALFFIGIKKAYGLNWLKSLVLAIIGLVFYQGMLLIFIR